VGRQRDGGRRQRWPTRLRDDFVRPREHRRRDGEAERAAAFGSGPRSNFDSRSTGEAGRARSFERSTQRIVDETGVPRASGSRWSHHRRTCERIIPVFCKGEAPIRS
jgi:hypothetical protein